MSAASNAQAAEKALEYPHGASREERPALLAAYREATGRITAEFKAELADEYASHLPVTIQNRIFGKAWEDGHSSGYHEIEHHYSEYVSFADDILAAAR